jgi:hypothetical protein
MTERGYGLDMVSPVQHAAAELDRVAPAALSIPDIAATYHHPVSSDLDRVRQHEHLPSGDEAVQWLISEALQLLGSQVTGNGDGTYRLARPIEEIRWQGRKITPDRRRRYIPGTRIEDTAGNRALKGAYASLASGSGLEGFSLKIAGPRGGIREEAWFTLHPLALVIPVMAEKEFWELAEDVRIQGILQPVTVLAGTRVIIDGRHRAAVASALGIGIGIREFTGGEDGVRAYVASENLRRRHLTRAQLIAAAWQLFGEQAGQDAREAETQGLKQNSSSVRSAHLSIADKTDIPDTPEPAAADEPAPAPAAGGTVDQRVARASGGAVSAATVRRFREARVPEAPETMAKISSGEIRSTAAAVRSAAAEHGVPEPAKVQVSLVDQLAKARTALNNALAEAREPTVQATRNITPEQVHERLEEIIALAREIGAAVNERITAGN